MYTVDEFKETGMKILIVKIAAIGDVIMSLPLLPFLRERYPKAHVTWVCGKQVAPLIEATGLVDRMIQVDEKALLSGNMVQRLSALAKAWWQLGGRFYDICLTAHADPRYRLISFPIRCKQRRFWERKKGRVSPVPGRYHAEEYVRLFSDIEGPDTPPIVFPKLSLPKKKRVSEKPLIAIAPGGAKNVLADDALRRWPIESYATLIQNLADYPVQVVVTGSSNDEWVKSHLKGLSYIDLIGQLDLLDLTALFQQCQLVITHDSGPLHLAKLAECPTIALFGPTNPWEKVGKTEKIKVLWGGEHLSCRPCYDGKTYAPCNRNVCLQNIHPNQVLKEALSLLNQTPCSSGPFLLKSDSYERIETNRQ